jgi:hypothetical protein
LDCARTVGMSNRAAMAGIPNRIFILTPCANISSNANQEL